MVRHLLIWILLVPSLANAQVEQIFIKGDYYNTPLIDFIQTIEQKHNVQFHYVNDVVKDVVLNGSIKNNTPLLKALDFLLQDKPISAATNLEGAIILFANEKKVIKSKEKYFKLSGQVKDKNSGDPLPYVSVFIPSLSKGTVSDANGLFEIKPITQGLHLVQFTYIGYSPLTRKINVEQDTSITIHLEESALQLKELTITPSTFEISTAETPLTLGKEEILHSPNLAKDIYRTLRTLPGIANNDYSAKARIRGGHSDETAVYLDHLLINDPFHLEEVDGTFSIFNTDYINELSVLTGGFSVRYADRLSGVLDVRTSDQLEADRYRMSIDLMNMSLLAQKKISDKVNVFFTARRGYLDFLLDDMNDGDDGISPRFSDFWAKVTYNVNRKNSFSLNFLAARDNFSVKDVNNVADHLDISSIRNNINGWVNWKWFPTNKISSITTLGYQSLEKDAHFIFSDNIQPDNNDENHSETFTLTNATNVNISSTSSIDAGFEIRGFQSTIHYNEIRYDLFNSTPDNIIVNNLYLNTKNTGYTGALYAQYNWTPLHNLIVQPGIRASTQQYAPKIKWAPRIAVSYQIIPTLTAKAAWGIYYQPDLYHKLRTSLGQETPYRENSEAIHYTGSLTFNKAKTNIMVNVYFKDYNKLFDDYRFEFFNRLGGVNLLDIPFNTITGSAKGFEIMVRQGYGAGSMLSVSYAYSRSTIRNSAGVTTVRDFDQPHTIIVNNIFRLPKNWNLSLLWSYHTGYPYTPTQVDFITPRSEKEGVTLFYKTGKKNSERLPNFHSLDLRMEKIWYFKKNTLMVYLNVVNFYNRNNLRSYWWSAYYYRNGSIGFEFEDQANIPFFISPGISFTLY